jgi:hypothetical protein
VRATKVAWWSRAGAIAGAPALHSTLVSHAPPSPACVPAGQGARSAVFIARSAGGIISGLCAQPAMVRIEIERANMDGHLVRRALP